MMPAPAGSVGGGFRHEAWLYHGDADFVARMLPFLRDAVAAGHPTLVMVPSRRIDLLWAALDTRADCLYFEDMTAVGANPALIIPAWRDFVDEQADPGRPLRGIGEPVWAGREPVEVVECGIHEHLLNAAFRDAPDFWLVCPYDASALDAAVVAEAGTSHPHVMRRGETTPSATYRPVNLTGVLDRPLSEPVAVRLERSFDGRDLDAVGSLVTTEAEGAGIHPYRAADLAHAVVELCTNSVRHAGGGGLLRIWAENGRLVCEVTDAGWITNGLVGRERPDGHSRTGRGLWLVERLCDLVQVRSSPAGTTVRAHLRTLRAHPTVGPSN